jgi:hypothetical protein
MKYVKPTVSDEQGHVPDEYYGRFTSWKQLGPVNCHSKRCSSTFELISFYIEIEELF